MGAGKTVQAIVSALESGAAKILVCPSAVKINWEREIQMFNCYDTYIVEEENGVKLNLQLLILIFLKIFIRLYR